MCASREVNAAERACEGSVPRGLVYGQAARACFGQKYRNCAFFVYSVSLHVWV